MYVVNMFDTGQAARVMNFSRFSLAHLLQHYCNVTADKQYQMADWRIRYNISAVIGQGFLPSKMPKKIWIHLTG